MVELAPIRRQRLFEEVAARLQRTIAEGGLREGDPLPSERELTSRFQVGRATIREALLALEQRGVVTVSNGERARVARPEAGRLIEALSGAASLYLAQPQGMRDFQALRRMVEAGHPCATSRAAADAGRISTAKFADRPRLGNGRRPRRPRPVFSRRTSLLSRRELGAPRKPAPWSRTPRRCSGWLAGAARGGSEW